MDEEKIYKDKKRKKRRKIILAVIVTAVLLYVPGWALFLHVLLKVSYRLPEYAEVVLKPNAGHWSCVCGNRTNIEMVFKVPKDKADQVETGAKGHGFYTVYVETFFRDNRDGDFFLDDCTYVYQTYDTAEYNEALFDFYNEEEKDCYYHVILQIRHGGDYENPLTFPLFLLGI